MNAHENGADDTRTWFERYGTTAEDVQTLAEQLAAEDGFDWNSGWGSPASNHARCYYHLKAVKLVELGVTR